MLRFLRYGTRVLRLESEPGLVDWLRMSLAGAEDLGDWEGLSAYGPSSTALVVVERDHERRMVVPLTADRLLALLINGGRACAVRSVTGLPQTLIMRLADESEQLIDQVTEEFGGRIKPRDAIFDDRRTGGINLCFTSKNLYGPVALADLLPHVVELDGDSEMLRDALERHALNCFNESLGDRVWHAYEVRIYDIYGRYDLHRRRTVETLEALDAGLLLGEGWGRDWARPLLTVRVYTFRLYSVWEPRDVKALLVGLEWDSEGERLGDFDLYENGRKVEWQDVSGRVDRSVLKARCRADLRANLAPDDLARIDDLERGLREAERSLHP